MQNIYNKLTRDLKKRFKMIKLLVMDFDGVFTDNKVYTDQSGRESVRCDRSDGLGIELLRQKRIKMLIVTREKNHVVLERAIKLKLPCLNNVKNKLHTMQKECKKQNIHLKNVCYIGNDINDIECLNAAGLAIAVKNSWPKAIKHADYVTTRLGGDGAVREICELIIRAKKNTPLL